jgi:nucleotide-sensitive chloride channel 1A
MITIVDAIFQALSECAALHPDKDADLEDDEDGEGDWIYSASDADEIAGLRQAALEHLESVFEGPFPGGVDAASGASNDEGQFEDADEEEEDGDVEQNVNGANGDALER